MTTIESQEFLADVLSQARRELVICKSPYGWSLHAPGSSDVDIASGDALYLECGEGEPSDADYLSAWKRYIATENV